MSFLINRIFPDSTIGTVGTPNPAPDPNKKLKTADKTQNAEQTSITKSVWSNYDADQNEKINFNEANSNSLFTMADVKETNQTTFEEVKNKAKKSINIKQLFTQALKEYTFNSAKQTQTFPSQEKADAWANSTASTMDSSVRADATAKSEEANRSVQAAYEDAVKTALAEYNQNAGKVADDGKPADPNALKADANQSQAKIFNGAQNTQTETVDAKGHKVTVNKTQSGNTSEVTTVNADGTKTVEITTKLDDGVTDVKTQKFDKKGRMRASEHTVTKGDETNTTTDIYRRNGSRKSENSVYTNTVDGMKYTTTNNNEYRRNGSLKTTTHTGNDGITNVTDFRRNGVDTKHTETRIGNTTTETRDYSRSGKKETVNTYNGDGTRTKTTNRFLDAQRQTLDNSTARAYDSNGNLTSKTQTSYSSTGAQQTAKTYNADGTVKSKENSVYSSFDNDQNGKATYDDSSVKNRFESFKTSMTSSIKVDGLSNDAMANLIKNANVDSDFETAVKGFSADSKAVLQKGDDPKAKQLGLNSKISMQIQRNAESALSGIKRNVETLGKTQVSMDKTIAEGGIAQYQSEGLRDLRMPAANDVFKSNTYTRDKRQANQAETYKGCKTIDDVMKKAGIKDDDLKDTQYKEDFIKANPSVFAQNGKVLLNADWTKLDIIRKKA